MSDNIWNIISNAKNTGSTITIDTIYHIRDDYCDCDERCHKCGKKKKKSYPYIEPFSPAPDYPYWSEPYKDGMISVVYCRC